MRVIPLHGCQSPLGELGEGPGLRFLRPGQAHAWGLRSLQGSLPHMLARMPQLLSENSLLGARPGPCGAEASSPEPVRTSCRPASGP